MVRKFLICSGLLAQIALLATSSFAAGLETITLPGSYLRLEEGQTVSISVGGYRHISKLIIRGEGVWRDAMMEVLVNGDTKGTIYAPGSDPSYVVTIAEASSSIELRGLRGTMNVRGIQAVVSTRNLGGGYGTYPDGSRDVYRPIHNEAMAIASRAIELAQQMEHFCSYAELGRYVLPLKKTAGRAYSVASVRNPISMRVHEALAALRGQIAFARDFLNGSMERDATFDLAVEFLTLEEQISGLLE